MRFRLAQWVGYILTILFVTALCSGARAAGELSDAARSVVGAWTIDAGLGAAIYRFDADGTFTLMFEGQWGGTAGGKWRVEGGKLVMDNTWSDVGYTQAGETESGQLVKVTAEVMELRSPNIKGVDEVLRFQKMPAVAPWTAGKVEHAKVVGTYRGRTNGELFSLSADGTAIFSYGTRMLAGQWSESGGVLVIRSRELGWRMFPPGRPSTNPSDPSRLYGTGQSSNAVMQPTRATTRPGATTRALGQEKPLATTRPSMRVYLLPPPAMTGPAPVFNPTTQRAALRPTLAPKIVEMSWPVIRVDDRSLIVEMQLDGEAFTQEFFRITP